MAKKAFEVDSEVNVGKFDITDKTRVRCRLYRKGKDKSVDLRIWYTNGNADGEFLPSPKGFSVNVDNIDKIIRMLEKAKTKIEELE